MYWVPNKNPLFWVSVFPFVAFGINFSMRATVRLASNPEGTTQVTKSISLSVRLATQLDDTLEKQERTLTVSPPCWPIHFSRLVSYIPIADYFLTDGLV